jgi:hypothetical protein
MKKITTLFLLIFSIHVATAQDEEINVAGLIFLNYQNVLPEGVLATKSVVLVSTPNREGESIPEDWHPLAEEAHGIFAEAGLDPVAYYFYDDVYSGKESRAAFAASWAKRGISNIVLLLKSEVNNNSNNVRYLLLITAFNGEATLMDEGQPAWKSNGKNLKSVMSKFTRNANRIESTNLLISDVPEYFNDVSMITGNRIQSYFTDLRIGKLAVPKFGTSELPGKRPGGLVNNLVKNRLEQAEEQANSFNNELATIMGTYRFEYDLVEHNASDEELMKQGFTYVLNNLHTSGIGVRRLLNYEVDEEEEYYMTVKYNNGKPTMRYIPIKAPIYKYYIKNLKTGFIYIGKSWDADETWQESLQNVIKNIDLEIK